MQHLRNSKYSDNRDASSSAVISSAESGAVDSSIDIDNDMDSSLGILSPSELMNSVSGSVTAMSASATSFNSNMAGNCLLQVWYPRTFLMVYDLQKFNK